MDWYGLSSGENGPIFSGKNSLQSGDAVLVWMNKNRGFQTDFVTVLDTSKRACTIKDSTVLFLRKRAKWFQKLNL